MENDKAQIVEQLDNLGDETITISDTLDMYQEFFTHLSYSVPSELDSYDLFRMKEDYLSGDGNNDEYQYIPASNESYISDTIHSFSIMSNIKSDVEKTIDNHFSGDKIFRFTGILDEYLRQIDRQISLLDHMNDQFVATVTTYCNICILTKTAVKYDNVTAIINNLSRVYEHALLGSKFDTDEDVTNIYREDPIHVENRRKLIEKLSNYDECLTEIENTI